MTTTSAPVSSVVSAENTSCCADLGSTKDSNPENANVECTELVGVCSAAPVKLVVFDLDETLTIGTYLPKRLTPDLLRRATQLSFDSPWLRQRRQRLKEMFERLVGPEGQHRQVAVLTRNKSGVSTILNFLKMAGLERFLAAIWVMPSGSDLDSPSGAYRDGETWHFFNAPFEEVPNEKADVLHHVAENPKAWFPQFGLELCRSAMGRGSNAAFVEHLSGLRLENVVLVDDDPENFHSYVTGRQVMRYCLVQRYDAEFKQFGVQNVGGIGARSEEDYVVLCRFVETPQSWSQKLVRDFDACSTDAGSSTDGDGSGSRRTSSWSSPMSSPASSPMSSHVSSPMSSPMLSPVSDAESPGGPVLQL